MIITFDIGGSNTRIGRSPDGKHIDKIIKIPTSKNFATGVANLCATVKSLAKGKKVTAIAGGLPGPLNRRLTKLARAPKLPNWNDKPLQKTLSRKLGIKILLQNDAALAGLGEAHFGAGKGYNIVAYLTISTGIGGARIVNQKIDANALGFEPGHQIIDWQGSEFEHLGSGTAILKKYHKQPTSITDKKIWSEIGRHLAIGIHNTIVHWSPEILIIGGGVVSGNKFILPAITYCLPKISRIFPELPKIKKSALEDDSGLYGALAYLGYISA